MFYANFYECFFSVDAVNAVCERILTDLHKYHKELDEMKNIIQARLCLALPANVENVKAIEKQEIVSKVVQF